MPIYHIILPRFIRLRDAPSYLGMDCNRFINREVRPSVPTITIGKQGIAFDRLDLDRWDDHYKHRVIRPNDSRGELWDEKNKQPQPQDYTDGDKNNTGILITAGHFFQNMVAEQYIVGSYLN